MKLHRYCWSVALILLVASVSANAQKPEIVIQSGHQGSVASIALSPDGRVLASASSQDKTVKLWEVSTGHVLRSFASSEWECLAVAFSPDGRLLASTEANRKNQKQVRVRKVMTGEQLFAFSAPRRSSDLSSPRIISALIFSRDSKILVGLDKDSALIRWDLITGKELAAPEPSSIPEQVHFTGDGRLLAAGVEGEEETEKVVLRDFNSGKVLRELGGRLGGVAAISFSPDDRILAIGNKLGEVQLWDYISGTKLVTCKHKEKSEGEAGADDAYADFYKIAVVFSPDGKQMVTSDNSPLTKLWDVSTGSELMSFDEGSELLAFNGHVIAVSGDEITLWDAESDAELRTVNQKTTRPVDSLAFSSDSRVLFSSDSSVLLSSGELFGDTLRLWNTDASSDCKTLKPYVDEEAEAKGKGALDLLFQGNLSHGNLQVLSPDGRFLATATFQGRRIKFWDVASATEIRALDSPPVTSLAFSPDGKILATGHLDKTIRLWNTATMKVKQMLPPMGYVISLAFSPDGQTLAVGSTKSVIHTLNLATGGPAKSLTLFKPAPTDYGESLVIVMADPLPSSPLADDPVKTLSFSPDGKFLAGDGGNGIEIFDLASGKPAHLFSGENAFAFSPDTQTLASGFYDETIKLHDMASRKRSSTLAGHTNQVRALAFSPNGEVLASGSDDETIRLWDAKSGKELAQLIAFDQNDWLVLTPDGLFDGSPRAWSKLFWRFSPNLFDVTPVEAFFYEYYRPGLLADLLAGKRPQAAQDISEKDRRSPVVKLRLAGELPESRNTSLTSRTVQIEVEVSEAPADPDKKLPAGGIRDVRLFRNGALVKVWHGDIKLNGDGRTVLEATIPAVAGENLLTAYAFNHDNVKSLDASLEKLGDEKLSPKGTVFILAIGVSRYANSDYNLNYTVDDAQAFGAELQRQQTSLGLYQQTEVAVLANQEATKANILLALKRLAGVEKGELPPGAPTSLAKLRAVQPEDMLVIYFSGHGTAQQDRFYLIPHDLGYTGARAELDATGLQTILAHSISDLELEEAFRDIDAGRFILVIDACNSGQALAADRLGPMNSVGLAQLAFEKGINILTASQNIEEAFVSAALHHSYLTFALVEEGLKQAKADTSPRDGEVWLREWFNYATARVPKLRDETLQRKGLTEVSPSTTPLNGLRGQTPRAFFRREADEQPLTIARVEAKSTAAARKSRVGAPSGRAGGNAPSDERIYEEDEVMQKARLLSSSQPSYTEEARKQMVQGTVRLRVVLSKSGVVTGVEVIEGLPSGLTEKAIEAAKKIKFAPARLNGRPVSQYKVLEFNFEIF